MTQLNVKRKFGDKYEDWVCKRLEKVGFQILKLNFYSHFGEIDIIAIEDSCLVFVEVKARKSISFGQPYEAVNRKKLEKIIKTGEYFRNEWKGKSLPVAMRIDVASVLVDNEGGVKSFELMKNVTR